MWIIKVALDRPYTFIVLALLILIVAPVMIFRTPTDIFPNINIPVVSVAWTYTGLNPEELEGRLTTPYEKVLTTLVDNIEHVESTTYNGIAVVKMFLQPGASLDTANAQVTAASQAVLRQLPPGTQPPLIINFSASSVPILQLGISGKGLTEERLNDLALNFLRAQLVTVPGAVVPFPYGGKQRQVMINMNAGLMQSKGLSPQDLLSAVNLQSLILPSGTAKIGPAEYDVRLNDSPRTVSELASLPVKTVNGATVYLRDVAAVADGFAPQTNIVRQDGRRGVLVTIVKSGSASTLDVVSGIRRLIPRVAQTLPPELKIEPVNDQSIFVRGAVSGVIREAVIAAALTGLMILLFLGSWRSTLIIAVSIPLSILTSVIVLGFIGETINIMTLGGLALAVGVLVDDATVTIENIERYLEEGHELRDAILEGAGQIAVPALVSTLCICIVFLPMFFLGGVARYLFVPLAEAVVFAMLASYILSRTLVPTLAMYLLKTKRRAARTYNPLVLFQRGFERLFEKLRDIYRETLSLLISMRKVFVPVFVLACCTLFVLVPFLGQDFFPNTDSGQFILHLRAKSGTRIEETARLCDLVENSIRRTIPAAELGSVLDNIGLPYSQLNTMHSTDGTIGAGDADVMVSLHEDHLHLRTIEALALAIDAKDHTTHEHLGRVRTYAVEIGKEMNLPEPELEALRAAALLHDIGKLAVPEHIISKPGKLTPEEFEKMKIHPVVGAEILERVEFPYPVVPIVRSHHEKWDGSGYPDGLQGAQIPIGARILAAVDCLDALASDRQYRRALPLDQAMEEIVKLAGRSFDPDVVALLNRRYVDLEKMAKQQAVHVKKLSTDLVIERGDAPAAGFEVSVSGPAARSGEGYEFLSSIAAARQEVQLLFEMTQDVGSSLSLDETLSVVAARLKRMVPYDAIAVFVCRDGRVAPEYVNGDSFRLLSSLQIPIGQGLSGWVAQTGRAILNGNPAVESGYLEDPSALTNLRSALAVPLVGLNETIGVMTLYRRDKDAFSSDHLRVLLAISSKVSLAMDNALKFRQAETTATTDFLTGLPNARSLFLRLDSELARAKRHREPLTVLVCDLDGFKQVNDNFGHLTGNKVLRAVGAALRDSCREYDYIARMGGDEFVLILPGTERQSIQRRVRELAQIGAAAGIKVTGLDMMTISIGEAFYPDDGADAEQLLAEADRRMYRAKRGTRTADGAFSSSRPAPASSLLAVK